MSEFARFLGESHVVSYRGKTVGTIKLVGIRDDMAHFETTEAAGFRIERAEVVAARDGEAAATVQTYGIHPHESFTTGEVADLLDYSIKKVCELIDAGTLKGERVAGSDHRRVRWQDLIDFCRHHRIDVELLAPAAAAMAK